MGDQGAGGGIESHMPTHRRQESGEEPRPTKPSPETRAPPQKSEKQEFTQTRQGLARLSEARTCEPIVLNAEVEAAPALSRNPSTCSTCSNPRPNEYLGGGDRRPQPPSRSSTASSKRPLEPPVTKTTLGELDVSKIIHNPKLRHDINFDPELHFRPNLDGEKGKKKQEKANQFWNSLLEQLVQFVVDREGFYRRFGHGNDWCLPLLLKAVKEIIETLVPQRDREFLDEGLNVDLLMQQFHRGVADLESLASWLSGVLKLHCAPMRDEWVDEMYQELSKGNRENDMNELVKGMRSLLSVLEAMKLDVANHQIRCLRPVLIEDTVQFEQRFFTRKMQGGKLSINAARLWYSDAQDYASRVYSSSPMPHLHSFGETGVFFDALSRLILPSTPTESIPNTFIFDEERIIKLRSDMFDSICLEICMRKFEDLERLSSVTQFCSRMPGYLNDGTTQSCRSSGEFNFNAPPTSRPSSLTFSDRGSNNSSPRNSGGIFVQPMADLAESRSKAVNLYNSLLDLLQTAPLATRPDQRWQGLAPSMALQILRYVNAPHSLPGFETQLAVWLGDVGGEIFQEVEQQYQQRLLGELAKRVKEFKSLSGVGLFSAATGGRIARSNPYVQNWAEGIERGFDGAGSLRDPREDGGIIDMATRLAHLGILHWRVWANLAYVGDAEGDLPMDTSS